MQIERPRFATVKTLAALIHQLPYREMMALEMALDASGITTTGPRLVEALLKTADLLSSPR